MSSFVSQVLAGFCHNQELSEPPNERYLDRELSWLEFNERVLEEARDKENPLFERLQFLGITVSNLDEFFMIRVASLLELSKSNAQASGVGAETHCQLERVIKRCKQFYKRQYSTYNRQVLVDLCKEQIRILPFAELSAEQELFCEQYFKRVLSSVLTPMAVDAGRPFPVIANKSLNVLVVLEKQASIEGLGTYPPFAILPIPRLFPRLLKLPTAEKQTDYILLEDVVKSYVGEIFDNVKIKAAHCFRIMRNADFEVDEEDISDLLREIEMRLQMRQRAEVIRLEIEHSASAETRQILCELLPLPEEQVFRIRGPIDLCFLTQIAADLPNPTLRYPAYKQHDPSASWDDDDCFKQIKERDIILHHPFDSFDPVVKVIQAAACDPNVLAIKQTLYRVSGNSPIVAALAAAARAGKQVMVLLELKARFDEERNIHWARALERAGCHVLYGIRGLKTHSKITLIVRQELAEIQRYVHIGTGNYNDATAKIYTDFGLWTARADLGQDAVDFFNMLSGYSIPEDWNLLVPAPMNLRQDCLRRIKQEMLHAQAGHKAVIVAKMNALVDVELIEALYAASQAGVIIRLIVRGICCLKPQVQGLSANIEVRSIVGRFLEHSRVFYYYNDGAEDLLIGSADWMPRNLDRRIELQVPLLAKHVRERVLASLLWQLGDNVKARLLQGDGQYLHLDKRGRELIDSQLELCAASLQRSKMQTERELDDNRLQPLESWEHYQSEVKNRVSFE